MEGSAFSAAVGVYKKFDFLYGANEDISKAPLRINQGFFRSLPASTSSIVRWNRLPEWTIGLSIVVPEYEQYKGDLRNDEKNISSLAYVDESLWVGCAMARKISESEGLGITLYYSARSFLRTVNDRSFISNSNTILFSSEKAITENAIVPILGYYKKINEYFSVGSSLRIGGIKVSGRGSVVESTIQAASGTVSILNSSLPESTVKTFIPAKLLIGVSWRPESTWLLTSDLSLREGYSYTDLEKDEVGTLIRHQAKINVSFGAEKKWHDWLHLRAGVYSSLSSQPDPNETLARWQEDKVDMLGFSANFAFFAGPKISYTFGGYYTGGRGRSLQKINQQYQVVPITVHIFTMLLGTSFSF
jgi:hypothetical protein